LITYVPGVRRSGEGLGLEEFYHYLREQRGACAIAGTSESART